MHAKEPKDVTLQPRLLTRKQAAQYCALLAQGFSEWVKRGRLPPSIPGTTRWDLKAIDAALDTMSGLSSSAENTFDQWKTERARKGKGQSPL